MLVKYKALNPLITQTLQKSEIKALERTTMHKKVRDFNKTDFSDLDKTLLMISKFAGISPPPDGDTRKMLMAYMKEKYSEFTIPDISEALKMAMASELQVKDIETYNKLSGQWISAILNAYRIYRDKLLLKYEETQNRIEREEKTKVSEKELETIMHDSCVEEFQKYRLDKSYEIIDMAGKKYDYLHKKGVLTHTKEQSESYIKEAKTLLEEELRNKRLKAQAHARLEIENQIEQIGQANTPNPRLTILAKKVALKACFDQIIKTHKNLNELL